MAVYCCNAHSFALLRFSNAHFNFGTWSGDNIAFSQPFCVQMSSLGTGGSDWWRIHYPYYLQIQNKQPANLPMEFWNKVIHSNQERNIELNTNSYPKFSKIQDCKPGKADNSILTMKMKSADLVKLDNGILQGSFALFLSIDGAWAIDTDTTKNLTWQMTIAPLVRVSNIDDFIFTQGDIGNSRLSLEDDICVYSNNKDNSYTLSATGNGSNGGFAVINNNRQIPFSVSFSDGDAYKPLQSGVSIQNFNAFRNNFDCNSGANNNAKLKISFDASDVDHAAAGNYVGIINIQVSAE